MIISCSAVNGLWGYLVCVINKVCTSECVWARQALEHSTWFLHDFKSLFLIQLIRDTQKTRHRHTTNWHNWKALGQSRLNKRNRVSYSLMVFDWFVFRVGRRRVLILLLFFGRRLSRRAHRPLQSTSRLVVTTPATHQNPPSPTRDRGNLVELPPTLFSRTTSLLLLPVKNSLNIETFWPRGIFETRISGKQNLTFMWGFAI